MGGEAEGAGGKGDSADYPRRMLHFEGGAVDMRINNIFNINIDGEGPGKLLRSSRYYKACFSGGGKKGISKISPGR